MPWKLAALVVDAIITALIACYLFSCATATPVPTPDNPCGIVNFAQVDARVYRGGQPTAEQWECLAKLGITDALELDRDSEGRIQPASGVASHYLPIPPYTDSVLFEAGPSSDDMARIDEVVRSIPKGGTWLIHCIHGRDRTGLAVAMYRVVAGEMDKPQAMAEAEARGFRRILRGLVYAWDHWTPQAFAKTWIESSRGMR